MPPPTDRKPGQRSFLMARKHISSTLSRQSEKRIHSALRWFRLPHKDFGPLFTPAAQRVHFSPQGVLMLYSTVPQPIDEDFVQRLREKGGL